MYNIPPTFCMDMYYAHGMGWVPHCQLQWSCSHTHTSTMRYHIHDPLGCLVHTTLHTQCHLARPVQCMWCQVSPLDQRTAALMRCDHTLLGLPSAFQVQRSIQRRTWSLHHRLPELSIIHREHHPHQWRPPSTTCTVHVT